MCSCTVGTTSKPNVDILLLVYPNGLSVIHMVISTLHEQRGLMQLWFWESCIIITKLFVHLLLNNDETEISVCDSEFAFYKKTTVAMQRRLNLMPTSDAAWADDQEGALHKLWCDMWCDVMWCGCGSSVCLSVVVSARRIQSVTTPTSRSTRLCATMSGESDHIFFRSYCIALIFCSIRSATPPHTRSTTTRTRACPKSSQSFLTNRRGGLPGL
jgi:hypothetical protein